MDIWTSKIGLSWQYPYFCCLHHGEPDKFRGFLVGTTAALRYRSSKIQSHSWVQLLVAFWIYQAWELYIHPSRKAWAHEMGYRRTCMPECLKGSTRTRIASAATLDFGVGNCSNFSPTEHGKEQVNTVNTGNKTSSQLGNNWGSRTPGLDAEVRSFGISSRTNQTSVKNMVPCGATFQWKGKNLSENLVSFDVWREFRPMVSLAWQDAVESIAMDLVPSRAKCLCSHGAIGMPPGVSWSPNRVATL